jgi:CheY-like chemotaxis protein/AraC-like DNA-binding protein/two-component sensor histidine kinase
LIYSPLQYLIQAAGADEKSRGYLKIIKDNAERMQRLITELLEFRNVKSENANLRPSDVDMHNLINEACNNFVRITEENKIDFKLSEHNLSHLYSDSVAIDKIVFNLLSNAFKYTPRYGYIRVEAWQEEGANPVFHFKIRNSGKGFTPRQISVLFNRSALFDTPNLPNTASHGIGMSITKSVVEQLGGDIEVTGDPGRYAEFHVVIPQLEDDSVRKLIKRGDDGSVPSPEKKSVVGKRGNIKILVVEDEVGILNIMKDILKDYSVKETHNGLEALEEVMKTHPDIIITDIVMPEMDGLELIDKLKADPKTGYIPVIGISGKVSVEDQINAYSHGADAYIVKPFYPRQVTATVENLLSRQDLLKDYFNSTYSSMTIRNGVSLHVEDENFIQKVLDFIKSNIDDESLTPTSIAEYLCVSKATLYRKFNDITDKTPTEYIRNIRLEYAARLLRTTRKTVSEIMYKSGFASKSYFYKEFSKKYGASPKDYRSCEK